MAFNCISLQLSSFVNIYVNICHYSFISGMLRASLDRLLGKNLCIKCIIQVPTKHPNERVLPITWKNQFIAFYRVPPKCETCRCLLPNSLEHWVQHQLVQLKAHLHLHLAAVFEGRVLDGGVLMVGIFSIMHHPGPARLSPMNKSYQKMKEANHSLSNRDYKHVYKDKINCVSYFIHL